MSILQDYEKLRQEMGDKKFNAIDKYIQEFGKVTEWKEKGREIKKIEDVTEWEKQYSALHKKCKPIFIEDVVMNEKEWKRFEKWYEKQQEKAKHRKERGAR